MRKCVFFMSAVAVCAGTMMPAIAQQPAAGKADGRAAMTAADYARAERFMGYNVTAGLSIRRAQLAARRSVHRVDRDWQRGHTRRSVKASKAVRICRNARERRTRRPRTGGRWRARRGAPTRRPLTASAPHIKDWNLWVRDISSGKRRSSTDGVRISATPLTTRVGEERPRAPPLVSRFEEIATFQQDQRKVGEMYLVNTQVGHPTLEVWKYPLPGDENVAMLTRVIIDVETAKITRLQMA